MIIYDMILIGATVLFDACALWLTVRAFKEPRQMSELQSAVVGFALICIAVILTYITIVSVIQTSQILDALQSSYSGSPSRTFGGPAKMWGM